jgi:hypothetical protein
VRRVDTEVEPLARGAAQLVNLPLTTRARRRRGDGRLVGVVERQDLDVDR